MKLIEWLKEGMGQKTLDEFEMEIEDDEITEAFKAGIIGQREVWLLTGDYKILKNGFPDVEADLPDDVKADLTIQRALARVKFSECVIPESAMEDLSIQRLLARQKFKGVVANKPVSFLRAFEGFYINLGDDENE